MTVTRKFEQQTKDLIDELKSVCATYGLGNDGNEFKIITQVFLYKFINDKFIYETKKVDENLAKADDWDKAISEYKKDDFDMLLMMMGENTAKISKNHFITSLHKKQNSPKFADLFDKTLLDLAKLNSGLFSVVTNSGEKITLFENISKYVTDKRDEFCRAIINKLTAFSFEDIFDEKFDFYATIFEYLIKDYNTNSGGKYAEYFTPHAVAKIMAKCLVPSKASNVTCYDPSAGSGTLLMNLAHQIGEKNCTLYSQDISQKSSSLLRLNLILNDLVHSIPNVVKGNTILDPVHRENNDLRKFDYIVSNPPFKLDFSDFSNELDTKENKERFFAGIPNVPAKKKESMAIYLMFLQHIMYSLEKKKGKAAIVVPTGFITAQSGIDKKIRQKMIDEKMLAGVVSMPSNIFAYTGTNVSIIFLDKKNKGDVVLIDASNLGETIKDGKNQKTVLTSDEENEIIETFNKKEVKEDFSVVVSYDEIKAKNYSLSAGQYFEIKIEYVDITHDEFEEKMQGFEDDLNGMFKESKKLEKDILKNLKGLGYE